MEAHDWDRDKLAKRSGIHPKTIEAHFAHRRHIQPDHLKKYMNAFPAEAERVAIYIGWQMDHGPDLDLPMMTWASPKDPKKALILSRQWLKFTGRTPEQEMGDGWTEAIHPDDRARVLAQIDHALKGRNPFFISYRLRRHDGVYCQVNDQGQPYYKNGNFAGYIGGAVRVTSFLWPLMTLRPVKIATAIATMLGLCQSPQVIQQTAVVASLAPAAIVALPLLKTTDDKDNDFAFDLADADWHPKIRTQQPQPKTRTAHKQHRHRVNAVQRLADKTINRQLHRLHRAVAKL